MSKMDWKKRNARYAEKDEIVGTHTHTHTHTHTYIYTHTHMHTHIPHISKSETHLQFSSQRLSVWM